MSVLVGSILTTVTYSFSILSRSRQTSCANQILQQDLETIRTYTWSQMTNTSNFGTSNTTSGGLTYTILRSVSNYVNSTSYGTNNMRKVTVTVTWTNAPGKVLSDDMTTVVTQGGLNDYFF